MNAKYESLILNSFKRLNNKLSDKEMLELSNIIDHLSKKNNDLISLWLSRNIKDEFMIDEYVLRGEEYEIKEFDDLLSFKSSYYGFLVAAKYSNHEEGEVCYSIYISYDFLNNKVGLTSMYEYNYLLESDEDLKTEKGFNIDQINDCLCEIRDTIENELIIYLEENNLIRCLEN